MHEIDKDALGGHIRDLIANIRLRDRASEELKRIEGAISSIEGDIALNIIGDDNVGKIVYIDIDGQIYSVKRPSRNSDQVFIVPVDDVILLA